MIGWRKIASVPQRMQKVVSPVILTSESQSRNLISSVIIPLDRDSSENDVALTLSTEVLVRMISCGRLRSTSRYSGQRPGSQQPLCRRHAVSSAALQSMFIDTVHWPRRLLEKGRFRGVAQNARFSQHVI